MSASNVTAFRMADFQQRIYLTAVSAPLVFIVFAILAMALGWPLRLATIMAAFALALDVVDLFMRAKRERVEVSPTGVRFLYWGLLRRTWTVRAEDIIEVAAVRAPFLPWGIPPITAYYFMPIPLGACLAIRTRQTPLKWVRWHAFRVEDREAFLDAVRQYVPQAKVDASLMDDGAGSGKHDGWREGRDSSLRSE